MGRFVLTATELIAQPSYGGKMHKLNALLLLCLALVFAANVQAQSNSGVNNAELNGNYAFTFSGFTGNSGGSSVFGAVGRFTADGSGNITDRKSTRLNSSHQIISYAVFCLK